MQSKFEQLLDYLVNEEQDKANELFHEIIVEKSRTIYENLIAEEEKEEEAKKHGKDHEEEEDTKAEESFGMDSGEQVIEIGGDPADDLMGDVEMGDEGDEEGDEMDFGGDEEGGHDEEQDDRIEDLEDALAELKAEFERLMAGEEGEEMSDEEGEEEEGEEEEEDGEMNLREYTEQVGGKQYNQFGKMGDNGENTKSPVASENRMGGTAFKLGAKSDEKGGTEGGLLKPITQELKSGNVNVPGGTNAKQFYKKDSKGHGAEKKGSGESAGNTKSPLAPGHAK